jgi:trehalose 6-phosphate phosphatase
MQALGHSDSSEKFFERVRAFRRRALLLDYDGTIAPFSSDWRRAFPYPGVRDALSGILASGATRLAVVSGRPEADVERLLGMNPHPEVWGSHGLEHRTPDGQLEARPLVGGGAVKIEEVCSWIRTKGWGSLLETKPFGLALHSRGVSPERFAQARNETSEKWTESLAALGMRPLEFDGGIEWRPAGHKGEVVSTVLSEMGPDAAVAYLGDDRTDEDAFIALRGRGLAVLVRPDLRATAAEVWIRPPDELLLFLQRWEQTTSSP